MRLAMLAMMLLLLAAPRARAWEPFRSENSDVREGNAELEKNQLDKALAAYGAAAKRLPNEAGVHLDRGIALLRAGKAGEAREALRIAATQGSASSEVRGKAQYNLGLAFMQDADTLAKEENLEEAQKLLRESADAFKSSLRATPKNRDAAWNLELAKRRLVDLEKKQQEKKDQQKKDEEQKKNDEDQQKKDDGGGDKSDDKKDEEKQDADDKKDDANGQEDAGTPKPEGEDGGAPEAPDAGSPEQPEPKPDADENKDQPQEQREQERPALPEHMQKALDALENGEENLQKHRAAMRARQRPRRIEKDW